MRRRAQRLKLKPKLTNVAQCRFDPCPRRLSGRGSPTGRGSHGQAQTIAPTSVFVTEHQVERMWTLIVGCWFKSGSPLQHAAIV